MNTITHCIAESDIKRQLRIKIFSVFIGAFFIFLTIFSPVHADITTGLVGHWKMDETSGTSAFDSSGNARTSTLVNGPVWTSGKYGNGVSVDGTNDYISIPDNAVFTLNPATSYTWSAWVKNDDFTEWSTVWSQTINTSNFFYFYAHTSSDPDGGPVTNGVSVYWWTNGGAQKLGVHSANNVLTAGQWSHVAVSYDAAQPQNNRFTIYVNGVDVTVRSDVTSAGTLATINPTNTRIAANQAFGEYLNGTVDEVRYYNRLLSSAEIQSVMESGNALDIIAPTVSVTNPLNGAAVSGEISLSATAGDNVGVAGVQFLLDNINFGVEDTISPYSVLWNTQTATNGTHVLTARARDAAGNIATSAPITVTVVPDFSFVVLTPSRTVETTGNVFFNVEVAYLNGFTSSNVDLWHTGLPAGVTGDYFFDPMSHQGQTQLSVVTTNAIPGTYAFTMGATAEGITHSQQATLIITTATDFALTASPSIQNITVGNSTAFTVNLTETNDFIGSVTLSVLGLPTGATASFAPATAIPAATSILTITTSLSTPPGTYNLTVQGVSGSIIRTTPITLTITSTPSVWTVSTMGSTGTQNNNVRVGALQIDGKERVYVGTIGTGRMLEYSWNGSAWNNPLDVGGSPSGSEIHNVTIGSGRGDGKERLYAASIDNNIYEIWHDATGWHQITVGSVADQAMHAAVGIGRNDGITRLYGISTGQLYEFTWNGTSWTRVLIGSTPGAHGVVVGNGRNDTLNSVYVASISSGTFEARFNGTSWSIASMGNPGNDDRDVELGVGRNDGVTRVYSAMLDGRIREFTWNGALWTNTILPAPSGGAQHIHAYVVSGRNDGMNRVYTSSGNGNAYEYTWNGSSWSIYNMGGGSDYMYGLHYGKGRNDGLVRFYGADRGSVNRVYEYTWVAPDSVAPTAPANLAAVGGISTASLTWTASTDNVGVALYNVHRSTTLGFIPTAGNRIAQPISNSFIDTGLGVGTYYYKVTAQDVAGNVSPTSNETNAMVTGDVNPPTVNMTDPADGSIAFGTVTVSANASDNVAVTGVQFLLNGVNLGIEDVASPYSILWNTASVANGTYTLSARARDGAGNVATSSVVTVTVNSVLDTTAPVISNVVALPTSNSAVITWITDENSDSQVEYGLTNAYGLFSSINPSLIVNHSVILNGLTPFTLYHYRVKSRDAANNLAVSSDVTFTTLQSARQTIFTTQIPDGSFSDGANINYELGMRFTSVAPGQITAIRFYKSASESGTHTGRIWNASGIQLASVVFMGEAASGWQEQALAVPLVIAANTEYMVSVNTGNTFYSDSDTGLASQIVSGDLRTIIGSNGRYGPPAVYPINVWMSSNYFRDIVFTR